MSTSKKKVTDGFFKENTTAVKVNGREVRVFSQEAEKLKAKLAKKSKK